MSKTFLKRLYSNAWIHLSVFAVDVQLSHPNKRTDVTCDFYSFILTGKQIFLHIRGKVKK